MKSRITKSVRGKVWAFLPFYLFTFLPLSAQRHVESLNLGWEFRLNDEGEWRKVDLPHDFQIEQPWVAPAADEKADNTDVAANIKSRLSSRGFKEMGKGYYRYHYTPSEAQKDMRILLDFEGIMYTADVYLNMKRIGGTDYGYVGFEIDITDELKYGEDNVIEVVADTRDPKNSRWYTGGGLFRNVSIVTTAKDEYFGRHPLYITTRDNKYVSLSAEFTNRNKGKETRMDFKVYDPQGQLVYEGTATKGRNPQTRTQEIQTQEFEISTPQLWSLDTPYLYKVVAQLIREDGSVADEVSDEFGIRTIEFGPSFGLKLNGQKVLLKGYANHHTLGALGAAAYPKAIEKRLRLIKQFGMNHIRTSHNPYSRDFIKLCDKYGILLVDELYDKWTRQHTGGKVPFEYHWAYDVQEWIKRDRNSPSVVLWSLGNELQQDPNQPFNDWGVTAYKMMKPVVERYDSTRLVTVAMHPRYRNWETDSLPCNLAMITDIQAYNYRYMYFPGDGRRFPWMTFYQSEASVSAMGENYYAMNLDKVIGLAYWGAIDYLGESQGWPAKGWEQGVFDIALEPKPKAYYMRSFFKEEEPLVHIAVTDSKGDMMWNGVQTGNDGQSDHWNRTAGQRFDITTYTNADEVELFVNGKSQGVKKNDRSSAKLRNQIRWENIEYQPGYCEAVARTAGKVVARHRIETTGKPVALKIEADNVNWKADGQDLQHLRIYAVDAKGRRVQTATGDVKVTLNSKAATLLAMSNGDNRSDELNKVDHRHLYKGSVLAILRSGIDGGEAVVTAECPGLKSAKIKMTVNNR